MSIHHQEDEHHVFMDQAMFGPFPGQACVCGEPETAGIHQAPPCNWCMPEREAPWWHRLRCRFMAWWLRP